MDMTSLCVERWAL